MRRAAQLLAAAALAGCAAAGCSHGPDVGVEPPAQLRGTFARSVPVPADAAATPYRGASRAL
jgi:hypothetical protein